MEGAVVSKYQMDMCRGPLFGKILVFAVPLIVSGILQLLFHAVDLIVVGSFASHAALAAVGATVALSGLIVNVFIGLSVGANVVGANCYGAHDRRMFRRTLHTAIATALIGGVLLTAAGCVVVKPILTRMATPEEILPRSCIYMWICCLGMPFVLLYNFGSAMMRAVGDTRRPLYYLIAAGIVNVLLNLLFVIVLGMEVAGVALATVLSQGVSAFLVVRVLTLERLFRLNLRQLRLDPVILKKMLWIGLPAGIQSSFFSISNLTIQSSINSFGALAMAGSAASQSLEGFVYISAYAFHQTVVSFTAQNGGGRQYDRVRRSILYCLICGAAVNLAGSLAMLGSGETLLGIYNPEAEVIQWGMLRMRVLFCTYFLCAVMDVICGGLRGLGHSVFPAAVVLLFVCVMRIGWVYWVFPSYRTMFNLMLSYPVSWGLAALVNGGYLYWICRQFPRSGEKSS